MSEKPQTILEQMLAQGYTRRDFLRFCSYITAAAGVHASGLNKVVKALETKIRPPVLWFHFQECTCCSESFIRSNHPVITDIVLDKISLDYTQTLQAAAGDQAEEALHNTMEKYKGEYIMTVEGAVPTRDGGVYCTIAGRTALDIVKEAAENAKTIIAWGSCASNGCIQAANPNPTGATPIYKVLPGKTVMNVPGCPPIAEVMAGVIVHVLAFDRIPQLDGLNRPRAFYSKRVHDSCYRRPFYDAGLFVNSFDDENARKGYCLYKVGCRGPVTYNSCGIIRWNNGVSYPIQSGHPCIGCSEANFWDNGPFYQHLANIPGFGIETTADKIGTIVGIGTLAGVAAHAISTNIRKRRLIQEVIDTSAKEEKESSGKQEGGE
ncbi:MAG: [Ni/Fe] hydrogenase small subunit [Calditrichaeota bacterium]|nr:hydrogenase small subunit [Calditrichota bacterium]RQW02962.1 MAG: [Ni/Fe] hydrogenase small subunit [Calditrichota bacterium]